MSDEVKNVSQRVVITAGASGIGESIAIAFEDVGARVAVCDISPEAVDAFQAAHPQSIARVADVSSETDMDAFLDEVIGQWGSVDVLVNNAGSSGPTDLIEDIELSDWQRCLSINLDGILLTLRKVAPLMKAQKSGAVINITSTAGMFGYPRRTPYAAAKFAVVGLTKSIAWELGSFNVRVNAVAPGSVDGPRMDHVISAQAESSGESEADIRAGYQKMAAMNTFIDREDIANTCVFLASPAAKRVSGQIIAVDGFTETIVD